MNQKIIIPIILLSIILTCPVFADEALLITEGQLQALEPGREISINRILNDGNLLCVAGSGKGQNIKILLVNPASKKILNSVKIPIKSLNYIASNCDGSRVIAYSQFAGKFCVADVRNGKAWVLFKRERDKPGFALYGDKKSRITFINGLAMAWGYFYDYKAQFDDEYVTLVDPDKRGMKAFKKLFRTSRLRNVAKVYLHDAIAIGSIEVNKKFLTFVPGNKKEARLVGFDLKSKKHFLIDSLKVFSGSDIAESRPLFAYVIKKTRKPGGVGALYLYNLKNKKKTKLAKGRLFNPIFSPDGSKLAVGSSTISADKKLKSRIIIIDIGKKDYPQETLSFKKKIHFVDWKFINNNQALLLFTGRNIYRYKLK